MTSHVARLYTLAVTLVAFFVLWAVVAAHPWASPARIADPRLDALAQREQQLRSEAQIVRKIVTRRAADYRKRYAAYTQALAKRRDQLAAASRAAALPAAPSAPSVRVVTLPPITITRTS